MVLGLLENTLGKFVEGIAFHWHYRNQDDAYAEVG
jgi:hypothetical protein